MDVIKRTPVLAFGRARLETGPACVSYPAVVVVVADTLRYCRAASALISALFDRSNWSGCVLQALQRL